MSKESRLSLDYLRSILSYNTETGIFIWISARKGTAIGAKAGTLDKDGYIVIMIDGINYYAHRLAWFYEKGVWPSADIDHDNTLRSDNRMDNLREATRTLNNINSVIRVDNTSGFKGVSLHKASGKWRAYIKFKGKQISLGYFYSQEEADKAYKEKARELYGDFAL